MNVRYMRANVAVTLWEIISKCDVCLAAPIGPIDQITEVMFQLQSQLGICELCAQIWNQWIDWICDLLAPNSIVSFQ